MPNTIVKIMALAVAIVAVQPAQAAGFSAAFGSLKQYAVATTGSIPGAREVETYCISTRGEAPSWDAVAALVGTEPAGIEI